MKNSLTDKLNAKLARRPAARAGQVVSTPTERIGRRITTVSLYQPDRERISVIQRAIEDAGGGRVDDSKAIRVALRAVETNGPTLLAALASLQADDGRRKSN